MGTWGVNLYQDDIALDVKEEYIDFLKIGINNKEATKRLVKIYKDIMEDDEAGVFWFALADTQWKYGRLLPEVKSKALEFIESGVDLELWKEDEKQYKKRQKVLEGLKDKLNSEQPQEKKITKLTLEKAYWEIGDILLYQILNEELKNHKWYKKYVLLNVVGINETNIGSLPQDVYYDEQNVISLYNWIGTNIPTRKEIKKMNFVILQDYIDTLTERREETTGIINFTKRELKKLNIKVIFQKEIKKEKSRHRNMIGTFYNIYNFDYVIIKALENAKKEGNLIDEC